MSETKRTYFYVLCSIDYMVSVLFFFHQRYDRFDVLLYSIPDHKNTNLIITLCCISDRNRILCLFL